MLDLTKCDAVQLDLIRQVVTEMVSLTPGIHPQNIMIVGAAARDVLHSALGHEFGLRATNDVDVAVALSDWTDYEKLTTHLPAVRGAGSAIRYQIADLPVGLMPFGPVEDPAGTVTPRPRDEGMSVWAFREVFEHSLSLPLDEHLAVRLPSIPGFTALKLCAWLDRAESYQYKDAQDIATAINWYTQSDTIEQRLYDSDRGNSILVEWGMDVGVASAHLLGQDTSDVLGPGRWDELAARWPGGYGPVLVREMNLPADAEWTRDLQRRREMVRGLERGLALS